jgi:hypothetical protein
LYATANRVEYDDESTYSNFDTQDYFVRYEVSRRRTALDVDVGYSNVSDARTDENGPLFRLNLERAVGTRSKTYLRAESQFTAAGAVSQSRLADPESGDFSSPVSVGGSAEVQGLAVGWSRDTPRNAFSLEAGWRDEAYQQASDFDRTLTSIRGAYSRRLRSTLTLRFGAEYRIEELADDAVPEARYAVLSAGLAGRISRRLGYRLDYEWSDRAGGSLFDYTENRIALRLTYGLTEAISDAAGDPP